MIDTRTNEIIFHSQMYLIRVSFTVSHGDTRIVSWDRYMLYIKPVTICSYVIEGIIAELCECIIDVVLYLSECTF